jgi:hypothetical protein
MPERRQDEDRICRGRRINIRAPLTSKGRVSEFLEEFGCAVEKSHYIAYLCFCCSNQLYNEIHVVNIDGFNS